MDGMGDTTMSMDMGDSTMDMGDSTMDMGGGGMDDMYMMKMWFHGGAGDIILFESWRPMTSGDMVWSCAIIFLMALVYEGIKYFRDFLYARCDGKKAGKRGSSDASTVELDKQQLQESWSSVVFSKLHLMQTLLHGVQFFLSYLLMLVFMTYNVWLCLAVILGACFGFFLFGWKKQSAVEITEHCH